jgi:hypothetical protein
MDFNLVNGVTSLTMDNNTPLTGFTNLSNNNTIQTLELNNCGFTSFSNLFSTSLPSTLRVFGFDENPIVGSTWPTNAFLNANINNVSMKRCGLNTTSVNRIINNIAATTTATNGTLNLSNIGTTTGTLNSPRDSGSDAALAILEAANWTVTTAP